MFDVKASHATSGTFERKRIEELSYLSPSLRSQCTFCFLFYSGPRLCSTQCQLLVTTGLHHTPALLLLLFVVVLLRSEDSSITSCTSNDNNRLYQFTRRTVYRLQLTMIIEAAE